MNFWGLDQWFDTLTEGTLICTPNQRLSRFYQAQYQRYQLARGCKLFRPLTCTALELWQSELWRKASLSIPSCAQAGVTISALQKRVLWQDILNNDETLWSAGDVLDVALEADKLLAAWGLAASEVDACTDEFVLFQAWARQYKGQLKVLAKAQGVPAILDEQAVQGLLFKTIASGELNALLPKKVIFTGFDQWPVPLKRFEQSLCAAGVACEQQQVWLSDKNNAQCTVLPSPKHELFAAAKWALAQSELGLSVAVVVPELGQRLAEVERAFQQVFAPESLLPNAAFDSSLINISSGRPLSQCPLVSCALRLLAWPSQKVAVAELSAWLLSPMVGSSADLAARTALLTELAGQYTSTNLAQLKAAVAERNAAAREAGLPVLLEHFYVVLETVHKHIGANSCARLSPSAWRDVFKLRLHAWGWPGSRTLNSTEYQQHEHWLQALDNFAALDDVVAICDINRALQLLTQVLKAPFHKQTPPAKVQILGVLEAAGQLFDGIWWLGLNSHTWPEALKLNPLLPAALQREHKMPRSHAGAELSYAQSITHRLCHSASQVVVSYAAFDGDEPLSPSPLIEDLPIIAVSEPAALHPWQLAPAVQLEGVVDYTAAPVPVPLELSGGVGVIKRQAACPFQAFAVHRLGASNREALTEGLDSRDRGNAMHEVLEFIWQRLETQQTLLAQTPEAIATLIDEAVAYVLARIAKGRQFGARLLELEAQRLHNRVQQWLEEERKREPFSVVLQEKTLPLELEGLRLTLRMDRVDCLADGKTLAVIDYKTGNSHIKSWQWPRIDEPQIPLYATALPGVGAAVFAQVSTQKMQYMGLSAMPLLFSELTDVANHKDWPASFAEVLEQWHAHLQAVAAAFVAGDAQVSPKNASSCQWCDLKSLCRINELNLAVQSEDALI